MQSCVEHAMRGASMNSNPTVDVLFFNGWSLRSDFVEDFVRGIANGRSYRVVDVDERFLDSSWMQSLASLVHPNTVLAGWSLGGMLAIRFARYLQDSEVPYQRLISLMAAPVFVSSCSWPNAMPCEVFSEFEENAREDLLLTKAFPYLMAAGSSAEELGVNRKLLASVKKRYASALQGTALRGQTLSLLKQLNVIDELKGLVRPVCMLFGANDQLVLLASALAVQKSFPQHDVRVVDGETHYLSDAFLQLVRSLIDEGIPFERGIANV